MSRQKSSSKNFTVDLELTRSVDEGFTSRRRNGQPHAISISIANASSMQRKSRLDPGRKIQEISETDIRFVRVRPPLGNDVAHRFVKIENSILDGSGGSHTPESLGSTVDRSNAICGIAVCIAFG